MLQHFLGEMSTLMIIIVDSKDLQEYQQACKDDIPVFPEKYISCGIVDEDSGELFIEFGSSYKTSDFIVDTLQAWWVKLPRHVQTTIPWLQIKVDNGPESSGIRTQFLKRMVVWVDQIGIPIQLVYYPPYHSKYNPIERCWGILEQHWNGTQLTDVETMMA